jgi:hypothetical protein
MVKISLEICRLCFIFLQKSFVWVTRFLGKNSPHFFGFYFLLIWKYTDPILYENPIDKIIDRQTEMQIGRELSKFRQFGKRQLELQVSLKRLHQFIIPIVWNRFINKPLAYLKYHDHNTPVKVQGNTYTKEINRLHEKKTWGGWVDSQHSGRGGVRKRL